jgi:transcription initiation factor IIE alpha subunit
MFTPSNPIIEILTKMRGEASFDYLVSRTNMSRTELRKHINEMEEQNIVTYDKEKDMVILREKQQRTIPYIAGY